MPILKDSDFFPFDDFSARLKGMEGDLQAFAQSTVTWAGRIKDAYEGTLLEIQHIKAELSSFSTKDADRSFAQFKAYDEQITRLGRSAEVAKQSQKGLTDAQSLNAQVIAELTTKLGYLHEKFQALDPSQKDYAKQQRAILSEVKSVSKAIDAQGKTLQVAKKQIDAVEGSYAHLSKQTNDLRATLKQMPDAFDRTTGAINKHNTAAMEMLDRIKKNDAALKMADASMGKYERNVGHYGTAIAGFGKGILQSVGGLIGISSAFDAITATLGVVANFERLDAGLRAVSRDTDDFNRSQQFLISTSNELGIKYESLVKSYKLLKAATKDTSLEGATTDKIFHAVAEAGARLQLSAEETEGALNALQQMISKGHIQAEELRGQLGDRLPGALKIMALATGVSTSELDKMMEKGQLLAVDVLPKFAKELDKIYGGDAQGEIVTMTAGWNRMTNEAQLFIAAFNENKKVSTFFGAIENGIAGVFSDLRQLVASNEWGLFMHYLVGDVAGGQANAAFRRASEAIRAKADAEFKALPLAERQKQTDSAIAKQGAIRNQLDAVVASPYSEENTAKEKLLQKEFDKAKARANYLIKLSVDATKEQDRADAARVKEKADADKQRREKEDKERTAAERKAQAAINRATSEALGKSQSSTGDKLAGLTDNRQQGLIDEQTFIEERLKITLEGLKEREAILRKYGKTETDDYINVQKEKKKADTEYRRAQLDLDLKTSRSNTADRLSGLDAGQFKDGTSDLSYIDQRHSIIKAGLKQEQSILEEAQLEKTELYKATNIALDKEEADYHKQRFAALKKAWKDEIDLTAEGLKAINQQVGQDYDNQISQIGLKYAAKIGAVEIGMAGGKIEQNAGERQIHTLRMQQLQEELKATQDAHLKDKLLSDALIDSKIEALKNYRDYAMLTPAEIEEANDKIRQLEKKRNQESADNKKKLDSDVAKNAIDKSNEEAEIKKKNAAKEKEDRERIAQAALNLAGEIGQSISSITQAHNQRDLDNLDKAKERELALAGDNADAKANIEKNYAKQKAEIQRKAAIQEREAALFSIAINTAQAVMSVLSTGGGAHYLDFGVTAGILSAFVTAAGLAQAAAVLAAPLPAYKTGKRESDPYTGPALAGEAGPELFVDRQGFSRLLTKPTIINTKLGDRVFTASQTADILSEVGSYPQTAERLRSGRVNEQALIYQIAMQGAPQLSKKDHYEVLAKALDERPVFETIHDEHGIRRRERRGRAITEYLELRYRA